MELFSIGYKLVSNHEYLYKKAQSIRPRVEVIVKDKLGRILLGEALGDYGKFFTLPGGGIEEGETLLEAAKRETQEETGKNVGNLKKIPVKPTNLLHPQDPSRGSSTQYVLAEIRGGRRPRIFGADDDVKENLQFYNPTLASRLVLQHLKNTPYEEVSRKRRAAILKALTVR